MNNLEHTVYTLPAHWACVLINSDYTGVTDEEENQIDNFIDGEFGDKLFCTVCLNNDDEPEFHKYHDARSYGVLACDCLEYVFMH